MVRGDMKKRVSIGGFETIQFTPQPSGGGGGGAMGTLPSRGNNNSKNNTHEQGQGQQPAALCLSSSSPRGNTAPSAAVGLTSSTQRNASASAAGSGSDVHYAGGASPGMTGGANASDFTGGGPAAASSISSNQLRYPLCEADSQRCQDAFIAMDRGTGELPMRHVRTALQRLGLFPPEEDLFRLIVTHDPSGQGFLTLLQFKNLVGEFKSMSQSSEPIDTSTIDAFVALGGNRDQSGVISAQKLRQVVRDEFVLPIDIDKLIAEADTDNSGFIDFEEFSDMLRD